MNTNRGPRDFAEDLCKRSICRVQVAAVLSDSRGIFSWGWNNCGEDNRGRHAEHEAIRHANKKRLRGALLTVAGFKNGRRICSRPCEKKCIRFVRRKGIRVVQYTTKEADWKVEAI